MGAAVLHFPTEVIWPPSFSYQRPSLACVRSVQIWGKCELCKFVLNFSPKPKFTYVPFHLTRKNWRNRSVKQITFAAKKWIFVQRPKHLRELQHLSSTKKNSGADCGLNVVHMLEQIWHDIIFKSCLCFWHVERCTLPLIRAGCRAGSSSRIELQKAAATCVLNEAARGGRFNVVGRPHSLTSALLELCT